MDCLLRFIFWLVLPANTLAPISAQASQSPPKPFGNSSGSHCSPIPVFLSSLMESQFPYKIPRPSVCTNRAEYDCRRRCHQRDYRSHCCEKKFWTGGRIGNIKIFHKKGVPFMQGMPFSLDASWFYFPFSNSFVSISECIQSGMLHFVLFVAWRWSSNPYN